MREPCRAYPTVHIKDPNTKTKLACSKQALKQYDPNNPVFSENEVNIYLNPKIGADCMHNRQQKKVAKPVQNTIWPYSYTPKWGKCPMLTVSVRTQGFLLRCLNS